MSGRRISIGSRAVAVGALTEMLNWAATELGTQYDLQDPEQAAELANELAGKILEAAWDVEYKPTAQRLSITFDVGIDLTGREKADRPAELTAVPSQEQ